MRAKSGDCVYRIFMDNLGEEVRCHGFVCRSKGMRTSVLHPSPAPACRASKKAPNDLTSLQKQFLGILPFPFLPTPSITPRSQQGWLEMCACQHGC